MARSIKHAPFVAWSGAASDKEWKRLEHGRERSAVRDALRLDAEPPSPRSYGDPARGPKDGKTYAPEVEIARRK